MCSSDLRKAKVEKFQLEEVVLKWDARNEEKGKHGKFENIWKGPFKIVAYRGHNAFLLIYHICGS